MTQYPLYDVPQYILFEDLIRHIEQFYSTLIAFEHKDSVCTYEHFVSLVHTLTQSLGDHERNLIHITASDSMNFAIAYFAVVMSNNIAVLADESDLDSIGAVCCMVLDDETITNRLNSKSCDSNKSFKTNPDDLCTIVCSSGTTSQKKGVMLSQRNLLTDTVGGMMLYEYKFKARYVNIIPYTHLFGIVADLLGPLLSGGTICCPENKLMFFEDLKHYKPTNLNLPPALVNAIFNMLIKTSSFEEATGGYLKKVMCAGAKMNDVLNEAFQEYGLRIYSAYGLTECSPCVSLSRDKFYKKGSAGMILPCCKVKIIDDEVAVSGENVMLGYYNDEVATERVMQDGWLLTGDIGYIDEDGFLFLLGRKNAVIVFEDGTKLMTEKNEYDICAISGINEVLISPCEIDSRIFLFIIIVIDKEMENYSFQIRNNVIKMLKMKELYHKVSLIELTTTPLKRNALGKIIRNNSL